MGERSDTTKAASRPRRTLFGAVWLLAVLLAASHLWAQDSGSVDWIRPPPTSSLSPSGAIELTISGLSYGRSAWVSVLRDCDGDGRGDREVKGLAPDGCRSPMPLDQEGHTAVETGPADRARRIHYRLDGSQLPLEALQGGEPLWIWAGPEPAGGGGRVARLGHWNARCSAVDDTLALFGLGPCDPSLDEILDVFRGHRAPAAERPVAEIRRLVPDRCGPAADVVPGTAGATGFSFPNAHRIVFSRQTVPPDPTLLALGRAVETSAGGEAGVYEVDLRSGEVEHVWSPEEGRLPLSVLALPRRRLAVALQGPPGEGETELLLLRGARTRGDAILLPFQLEQLMTSDDRGRTVLAEVKLDGALAFARIDLRGGDVTILPWDGALVAALRRRQTGTEFAFTYEDLANSDGIELVLMTSAGMPLTLRRQPGDDWAPRWDPNGTLQLYYLAERRPREWTPEEMGCDGDGLRAPSERVTGGEQ